MQHAPLDSRAAHSSAHPLLAGTLPTLPGPYSAGPLPIIGPDGPSRMRCGALASRLLQTARFTEAQTSASERPKDAIRCIDPVAGPYGAAQPHTRAVRTGLYIVFHRVEPSERSAARFAGCSLCLFTLWPHRPANRPRVQPCRATMSADMAPPGLGESFVVH